RGSSCAGGARGAAFALLDARGDALLLDIDVQYLRLDGLAPVMEVKRFLAGAAPRDVGHVDHAVDVALEAYEQPEFGCVLHFALDRRADRMLLGEGCPRILLGLLEAEGDPPLLFVDLEPLDVHFL